MNNEPASGGYITVPPSELSAEFFEGRGTTFSADLFRKLAGNPLYDKVVGPRPSQSKMLTIATVIISAMDQKIEEVSSELAREKEGMARFRYVIDGPLFKASAPEAKSTQRDNASDETDRHLDKQEWSFFQRYLTLRNILSFLVVALGMLGSVLVYLTSDFKGRADAAESKIESIERNAKYWQEEGERYRGEVEKWRGEADKKGKDVARLEEAVKSAAREKRQLDTTLNGRITDLKAQIGTMTASQDKTNKEIADLRAQNASLRAQLAAQPDAP